MQSAERRTGPTELGGRVAWHHFALRIPSEWEVVGYTKNPDVGRLVLADRLGQALQISWKVMGGQLPVRGLLEELVASHPQAPGGREEIRKDMSEIAGWHCFLPRAANLPAFAARFVERTRILLNLAFSPRADINEDLVRCVLESWQPNDGAERAWVALGLDFTMPEEMKLEEVVALPARQVMRFENRRGESVTVHRYGMMPLALGREDVATFFARIKGRGCRLYRLGEFRKDGKYDGAILGYITRGRGGFDALLARSWVGRVWVWRCDDLKRVYAVDHNAPEKHLIEGLPERVRCI